MTKPIKLNTSNFLKTITPIIPMPILASQFDAFINEIILLFNGLTFEQNLERDFKKIVKLEIKTKKSYSLILNKGTKKENVGWAIILAITGISNEKIKNYILPLLPKPFSCADVTDINSKVKRLNYFAKLFIKGHKNNVLKKILADDPITLRRFTLKKHFSEYKKDKEALRILLENKFMGRFGQKIGDYVEENILGDLVKKAGSTYEKGSINFLRRYFQRTTQASSRNPKIDLIIPNKTTPKILVESSYTKTTASGQTKKIDANDALFSAIKKYNRVKGKNLIFVNFIDGAGWKMRGKSDLKRFIDSCDFAVNYKNLGLFRKVLDYYL